MKIIVKDKKSIKNILIVCIVAFIALTVFIVFKFTKYSSFAECEAAVITVNENIPNPGETSSTYSSLILSYEYLGEKYTAEQMVTARTARKTTEGDIITIKINPEKPEEIADSYASVLWIVIDVILLIFCIFMIIALAHA